VVKTAPVGSSSRESEIVSALEAWFQRNGKDYPWRQTRDPYAILVSEVMLQQTQITTVLERGYFQRWMQRFPDFTTLANATEAEVLKLWEGLGYYRRARNLQKLAQAVVALPGSQFPQNLTAMRALPGVGPYTAGAVASFAYDLPAALVDGNVARVISRLNDNATPIDSKEGQKQTWQTAEQWVQHAHSPRAFNSALMELGQTVCRVGKPACLLCPVKTHCRATTPEALPVKTRRTTLTEVEEHVIYSRKDNAILLEQETGSRRTGLWKLPQAEPPAQDWPMLLELTYGITRYRVKLRVHATDKPLPCGKNQRYVTPAQMETLALGSPYKKALKQLHSF
jgi:A/G-specific adenine glycosylase